MANNNIRIYNVVRVKMEFKLYLDRMYINSCIIFQKYFFYYST